MPQTIEVIEWKETDPNEIVHRFEPGGEIKLGAQLIIHEDQWAVFFRDGKALDVFRPGRHTLTTMNLPLLTKALGLPLGGTSPFRADVYFISRRVYPDLKWGTREPILFRDAELQMVRLRAFGVYAIRVMEPQLFLNTLVGTQQVYTVDQISGYLRDLIVARLNDILGENLRTVLDLPQYYDEIAAALKYRVKEDFAKYGLELTDFFINAITPPDEVQRIIDERTGIAALGGSQGMQQYVQFKTARAIEEIAQQPPGEAGSAASAGMGLGAGLGLGMMLPSMIQKSMQSSGTASSPSACPNCQQTIPADAKFCPHCGMRFRATVFCGHCGIELPATAKYCMQCGRPVHPQSAPNRCSQCQAENPPDAKFCANCGQALAQA